MLFFKKKTAADKTANDRSIVEDNSLYVDALIAISKSETLTVKLKELREKLKYLISSDNAKVLDCDKKIKNQLEDIKLAIVKEKPEEKLLDMINEVYVIIAERNIAL